jgi:hypothetical protein
MPEGGGEKENECHEDCFVTGKSSLKQLSSTEVASTRLLKQSKKTVKHLVAVATTTCVPARAFSSKVAVGASSPKGAASAKKIAMPVHKCRIPAIAAMATTSSEESLELPPHGRVARDSTAEITSRLDPCSQ